MALFIGRAGQMTGKLPYSRMKTYGGDGYAVGDAWALDLHQDLFPALLLAVPSMGQRCVSVLLDRVREVTRMEQQAEKLSALGKLAANLAHELNNPASAAQRTAASLLGELREYGEQKYRLGNLCLTEEESANYTNWVQRARKRMSAYSGKTGAPQSPLAINDREDYLVRWLDEHKIPKAWTIAPSLAETQLPIDVLDELASLVRPEILTVALATVASSIRVERMAETVVDSTVRIFDLISAIKDYSYMDQAPIQDVDLAQSLENTLIMFNSRLKNTTIELDFDPTLPPSAPTAASSTRSGPPSSKTHSTRWRPPPPIPPLSSPPGSAVRWLLSKYGTTVPAYLPPSCRASSSPSSPPKHPVTVLALASTPSSASSASTLGSSASNPNPEKPASRSACR